LPGGAINAINLGAVWSNLLNLATASDSDKIINSLWFDFEDGSFTNIGQVVDEKELWQCELTIKITQNNVARIPQYLNATAHMCRRYLNQGKLHQAELDRQGGGLNIPPSPPLADNRTTLIVTTSAKVQQNYEYPETFFSAWDSIEQYSDRYLLLRGIDCADNLSFFSHIINHQWNMARAAKPNLIKDFLPQLKPEEIPIIETEESYLNMVGYIPAEKVVEYTCWVDADEHIQGWEIINLWDLIKKGSLLDGRQVDAVRVVFLNREMAEREK
jgi:hypothetical protein